MTLDPDDLVHTWCDTHAPTRTFCGLWPAADMCEDDGCDNGPVCPTCDDLQCGCEL